MGPDRPMSMAVSASIVPIPWSRPFQIGFLGQQVEVGSIFEGMSWTNFLPRLEALGRSSATPPNCG